ncbi:MAG: hypothetical protein JWL77_7041 [Chthonomonadaceae bacterium]|nr:hypothetical protein [Chthonomonadaceae bacterium]
MNSTRLNCCICAAAVVFSTILTFAAFSQEYLAVSFVVVVACSTGLFAILNRLDVVLVLTLTSALVQPTIVSVTGNRQALLATNIAVVMAGLVSLFRGSWQHRRLRSVLALAALALLAIPRSTSLSVGALQGRQVLLPLLLMLVGSSASLAEWKRIKAGAVWVSALAALYVGVELIVGRPLTDALVYANSSANNVFSYNGLPGYYYYYYSSNAPPLLRAGGPLLSPTTSGLLIASGVVLVRTNSSAKTLLAQLSLTAAAAATLSRGALLIIGSTLLIPRLSRITGRKLALMLAGVGALYVARILLTHGGSAAHSHGLAAALGLAISHPAGQGFGHFGDLAVQRGTATEGESLFGLLLAAGGIPILIGLALLVRLALSRVLGHNQAGTTEAAFLGLLLAAFLSETAGALSGTIALWLIGGRVLAASDTILDLKTYGTSLSRSRKAMGIPYRTKAIPAAR